MKNWWKSGAPWIWLTASAVSVSVIVVMGLLILIAVRGLEQFYPSAVMQAQYKERDGTSYRLIAEIRSEEEIPAARLREIGFTIDQNVEWVDRYLVKTGNRDLVGLDFRPILAMDLSQIEYPQNLMIVERYEWGNFYGFLRDVKENGTVVKSGSGAWEELQTRITRANGLFKDIEKLKKHDIGRVNYQLEQLRLWERRLELNNDTDPDKHADIAKQRAEYQKEFDAILAKVGELTMQLGRDSFTAEVMDGKVIEIPLSKVVRAYLPNAMTLSEKLSFYFLKIWEFITEEPREANTEGGIFPAIFGTVLMVFIMSIFVTPLGVIAAVYLREYAKQGVLTRMIRIAVNNLAGVPSIVYGVFGLGFFVYMMGSTIDKIFYPEALPAPTFGTGGILWSAVTLAILTLPVVIVSTEEGLSRIPSAIREGSLALGATKAETLWRIILPMASPSIMTGMILAIARAAGEVAPLMLVGVVKLAPTLPMDGNFPYLHLERKFMHLGFHVYDVGFQSPNVEAARPLVYTTSLLLVAVIVILNLSAIAIRNRLREKYKALESA
ncbi:phosphate ABC transporter permease PstA [Beggiatoa leptomitoformis]|uniref:Phosphate transport system permease protein PstA n=1 Tax=Beggiatoa leptomitoformis TaxID=288004 RepID=A0A2N9YHI5_9GAMM|nr:phosphate ABC transporter permease PstA [Beggiatoa leptomitoformis]ALG67763.1 phosphate ABC transporter permease PstA [Beggiatoa leptomitoformis]AUI69992.1 phosphate ABC transporter permease PstA [Beggiatoa leptomitoformis]